MHALKLGFAAILAASVISACDTGKSAALAPVKTTPAELEKHIEKLAASPFKMEAKGAADIASVRDALPKAVSLTWAKLDFDAATGATVLKDVKLTPADNPKVGLGVSELRLWDFNADLAKARLNGQRLAETGNLARRIEALGTSIFGLETLISPAMEAYTGAIEKSVVANLPAEVSAEVSGSMQTKLEDYEFSIGRLVFDDVKLRPYELKLAQLPPENGFAEVMPLLQTYVAVSRSFGVDTVFMSKFTGRMAMTQAGEKMAMNFTADTYGVRGMRGSDIDAFFMRDVAFDMNVPMGAANAAAGTAIPPMNLVGGIDYASAEGMRLDKVAGYLARGEWPPRTETDLMSYGLISLKNEHFGMNGRDMYSVGEVVVDARKWHWFIPTKVSVKTNDVVYDIKAFVDFATQMEKAAAPGALSEAGAESAAAPAIDPAIMQLLTKYGLDKPSIDFALGWDWNPTTGAATFSGGLGLDHYMHADVRYDGDMPTFKGVSDLIPGGFETAKGEEIAALFEKTSTLKGFELNVNDEGGLEKIFAFTAEIGKTLPPEQTGGIAMFANATPASLRQMASAGVYLAAEQAETAVPGAKALLAPFGAFVEKGGKVRLTLSPKAPMPVASTSEQVQSGTVSPLQLFQQLNGKTVHTPPGPVKP